MASTVTVLRYIERYIGQHGYPPSVREIQRGLTMASPSTAIYHLRKLERAGRIECDPGVARGIRLTGEVKA